MRLKRGMSLASGAFSLWAGGLVYICYLDESGTPGTLQSVPCTLCANTLVVQDEVASA